MSSAAFQILIDRTGPTLLLSGDWTSLTLGEEAMGLRSALLDTSGPARVELKNLGRLDTAGAYAILRAIHPSPAPAAAHSSSDPPRPLHSSTARFARSSQPLSQLGEGSRARRCGARKIAALLKKTA